MPEPTEGTGTTKLPPILARPGWQRWILLVAIAALLPKCLLCVAGYLALAVGFVTATTELCGETAGDIAPSVWGPGIAIGVIIVGAAWLSKFCPGFTK